MARIARPNRSFLPARILPPHRRRWQQHHRAIETTPDYVHVPQQTIMGAVGRGLRAAGLGYDQPERQVTDVARWLAGEEVDSDGHHVEYQDMLEPSDVLLIF